MEYDRVSYVFSDEQLDLIKQSINTIKSTIEPTRTSLTTESRRRLAKMGDRSHPFTEQALKLCIIHPEFLPSFRTVEEFQGDWSLTMQLKEIHNDLKLLIRDIYDTYMAAGADSYSHAREYYISSQRAAKDNRPGAQTVVDELKPRFVRSPNHEDNDEEQNPTAKSPATTDSTAGK
jgi:hypothetical protein